MTKFKNELGRSMVEMLLYIGLVIVIGVSTIKLYSESVEKSKRINAQNQIRDLIKDVNMIYIGRNFPTSGDISEKIKKKGIKLVNPWGDSISIIAKNAPTGGTGSFALPYFGIKMKLSKARCAYLGSALEEDTIGINVKGADISTNAKSFDDILKNCKDNHDVYFWVKKE